MEFAYLYIVGSLVALLIAVLWIALPFAVFGTKPILESILRETKAANQLRAAEAKHHKAMLDEAQLTTQRLLEVKIAIELLTKIAERDAPGGISGPRPGP